MKKILALFLIFIFSITLLLSCDNGDTNITDTSGKVTSAEGYYDTDYGRISVKWQILDGVCNYVISLPDGISANFDFADMSVAEESVDGGVYSFKLEM